MARYIISCKYSDKVGQKDVDVLKTLGKITYVGESSFGIEIDVEKEEELRSYCRERKLRMAKDGPLELQ